MWLVSLDDIVEELEEFKGSLVGLLAPSVIGLAAYIGSLNILSIIALAFSTVYLGFEVTEGLLRDRRVRVDSLLMAIVGLVLLIQNILLSGLLVMLLYAIAELLEASASAIAKRRLKLIPKLLPHRVLVDRGSLVEVEASNLRPGDVLVVRRGEVIAADGILLEPGLLDTSSLTGEPTPQYMPSGGYVYAGFVNVGGGPIRVRVTRAFKESRLFRIVDEALKSLEEKGRIARIIDRFLWLWLPIVLLSFILAYVTLGVERAASILVVSCPSAFIISSSVNAALSVARLAGLGVVARGARALESLSEVNALVLDKTGTLTLTGRPRVSYVKAPEGLEEEDFKAIVSSLASASLHPVSRALSSLSSVKLPIDSVLEHPGLGVEGLVNGKRVLLGSINLLAGRGLNPHLEGCGEELTTIWVSVDGSIGYICLEEVLGEYALNLVRGFKGRIIIASGDRSSRVKRVASKLGVTEYYAEMTPEGKRDLVGRLRREGYKVAFVGDGINDVLALTKANVGIAVGSIDMVAGVGDIALGEDPGKLSVALEEARLYTRTLKLAITVIATIKLLALAGGLLGILPLPIVTLLGDDGSTILGLTTITAYRTLNTRI